jgi:hypothetical protein
VATAQQALDWVDRLYRVLSKRRPIIEQEFNYFRGDQPLVYATQQWRQFHQDRYKGFADNWCGVVARAPVDRLRIDGFSTGEDRTPAEKSLWDDWQRNELELQSKQGFLSSAVAKRSASLVWGSDDDEPVVTWEQPAQVVVAYSRDGYRTRRAALKAWTEDDAEYATLYLPDEVWKFQRNPGVPITDGLTPQGIHVLGVGFSTGGGWQQRIVGNEKWPLSNPFGEVPVVEWLNQPLLGADPLSEISGTIAMQDAINMLWAYLFTAADYASMPARVVLGAEPPRIPVLDDQGQVIGSLPAKIEDLAQGRLMFLPGVGNQARIDQWDAAKLDVFTAVIGQAIGHIASQTSTPGHYLNTNDAMANLNGDALTSAEVPLATKVVNAQSFYSPPARDTLRLMAKVRGDDGLAETIRTSTIMWKDAAMHSLPQIADAATKDRAVGISLRTVLETRYGMDPDRVDEELRRVREEQTDPMMAQILKDMTGANANTGAGA